MLLSQQRITPRISDLFSFSRQGDEQVIRKYVPKRNHYWLGSGREALRQILLDISKNKRSSKKMSEMPEKGSEDLSEKTVPLRVGMPAYTCHVVLNGVKRSGCVPVFYDSGVIADVTDIQKIIKNIDVLVVCYNFGFLPDVEKIAAWCKKNNVILIEDCAQALGARYQGRLAGSFGDYAFYSFGISKTIGFCGGLIASDKELHLQGLRTFPVVRLLKTIAEVVAAPFFFHKTIYSLTRRFLHSELEKEQEQLRYTLPEIAKRVVISQVRRYDRILAVRRRNAEYLLHKLPGDAVVQHPTEDSEPSWLYFCFMDRELPGKAFSKGVEVGRMLTFQALEDLPKAKAAEASVFTITLYRPFAEVKKIAEAVIHGRH